MTKGQEAKVPVFSPSFLLFCILLIGVDAQYQWSCSPLDADNNRYILPDLGIRGQPDVVDIRNRLTGSDDSVTYFFPIPSTLNCSGIVSAVHYCYIGNGIPLFPQTIFTLLILEQNNLTFTITDTIPVTSTQSSGICDRSIPIIGIIYCCDTFQLNNLILPTPNFAFGIIAVSSPQLLTFDANIISENEQFFVEHFRFPAGDLTPTIGTAITLSESDRYTDMALRVLQFMITINEETTSSLFTTDAAPTSEATTTSATTTSVTTTSASTPRVDDLTSLPTSTTQGTVDVITGPGVIDSTPSIVGVAVGVVLIVVVVIVLLLLIILAAVGLVKRRKQRLANVDNCDGVFYDPGRGEYDYARIGPHAYSNIGEGGLPPVQTPKVYIGRKSTDSFVAGMSAPYEEPVPSPPNKALYDVLVPSQLPQSRKTSSWTSDSSYMVPGKDEGTLYAQLSEIQVDGIPRGTIGLGDLLGSGQFGMVYKGVWHSSTQGEVEVAVKTLKEGSKKQDRVKFLQEAATMGQFKHPNVVTMYGVVTDGEPILLVLELLSKGDLRDHLCHMRSNEEGGDISVDGHTLLNYCRQVASGMAYLSSKAFVHRDLAARNILVSEGGICKIADFGMSRDLMNENYYISHGGKIPVKWTAPEAINYKKYSTASDVWSYGILMYEIWSVGHKPYQHITNKRVVELVVDTGFRMAPPPGCPRALYTIMISCWNPVKSERPSFADISTQLSLPDTELLKWSEEDKFAFPEADKLGANLLYAQDLYKDLQVLYSNT